MNINDTFRYTNIPLPEDILRTLYSGEYDRTIRLIDMQLSNDSITQEYRNSLVAHREMIRRVPNDYPFTRKEAIEYAKQRVSDFTEEEFDSYVDTSMVKYIYLNGEARYFERFFDSLCKSFPAFSERAGVQFAGAESALKGSSGDILLEECIRKMKENGSMTNRIRIRASVKVKDECFHKGMFVRVHIPVPASCEQQGDICIEKIFPEGGMLSDENSLQRTVCWEEYMTENHEFVVEYSYLYTAKYTDTTFLTETTTDIYDNEYTKEEYPHIVFTPYIKNLAQKITEGINDPIEKARAIYDYITLNVKYTFMPSYFSLENIPENCAKSLTGDCGVLALLFITLCRCVGIPARWQSGLAAEPDFCGCHDWARFYVAPYGWLYADVSYGVAAVRLNNEDRRKFYFGNTDSYRMVANNAFQADFEVTKMHWRCDPYDNQTGEIETSERGLCFDEYIRKKEVILCEEIQ
ncbi:MAG: transglutaminase domain-containing protein [Anaerofustis stercorihominis]|nr:transglutaminase domain-containing protein [Anaerofustis stercorihominis]